MAEVRVGKNESLDTALKRFKRSCAKDGVIADFVVTTTMLQEFIHKALKGSFPGTKARVIICIPSGVTAVERRPLRKLPRMRTQSG